MKPKTKKILIIVAAIVAIVAVVYFAGFRKAPAGTAEGYIDRLDISKELKKSIKSYLEQAAIAQDVTTNAAANGINYEQALALTAAYYLVQNGTVDDATWQSWKAQIKAM